MGAAPRLVNELDLPAVVAMTDQVAIPHRPGAGRALLREPWVADLRRRLEEPRLNVPVFYADSTRTGGPREVPEGGDFFVLMLIPTDSRTFPSYTLEIYGAGEDLLWSSDGLVMSDDGSLRLGLSRRFLPPGSYRVQLYGGEEHEPIEDYSFEIR